MRDEEIERLLLQHVQQPGYKPSKPRVLAKRLNLSEEDGSALKRAIKKLVKARKLSYGSNHLVGPPQADGGGYRVTGVFRRTDSGYGFVRPAGSAPGSDRAHDIYIAARDAGDAATGDTVLVRLKRKVETRRPNPEGVIVEVIERETHQFVGTYFEQEGTAYARVDGAPFSQPILLGDPGAKDARVDDKVVFEMVRFPAHGHEGEGVIIEVLGPRGTPGVDTLSIIREFNLPEQFAEDAVEEGDVGAIDVAFEALRVIGVLQVLAHPAVLGAGLQRPSEATA